MSKITQLINYEPFFNRYKPKDIIYPGAVARHFSMTMKDAYELCQSRVGKDLRTLYMINCPVCNRTLPGRYYAIPSIDIDYEYGCTNCDCEFTINLEENVAVYFEKM